MDPARDRPRTRRWGFPREQAAWPPKLDLRAPRRNLPGMAGTSLSARSLAAWLLAAALACLALWVGWSHPGSARLRQGAALYARHCAACHGARLEGQPDWQIADADGRLPAPPHDASGHTWHHGDAMLADYVRRGGQAVLDDLGVPMTSGMPAFGETLTEGNIAAILAFIKSNWPARLRAVQARRNGG